MQSELVHLLLKVFGISMGLMAMIMLCCIATPYLAKRVDRIIDKNRKPEAERNPDEPAVRGPYDASTDEKYDLNYKIYNKDIYGVDFKNGKEE